MGLGFRELVRLKMTPQEVNKFMPPQGIDISWKDYDYYQGEVTADITGVEWSPPNDDTYLVYPEEINSMLADLKVTQDGIKSSKYPTSFVRTFDVCSSFVEDTPYDYLLSKGKTSTEIVDKTRLNDIGVNADMFYDERNRKRYKLENVGFTV